MPGNPFRPEDARAGSQPPPRWIPSSTAYTFDPLNGTLLQGSFDPPTPGYPWQLLDLPGLGEVVAGDSQGGSIYVLNTTTGKETSAIRVGNTPDSFSYNPRFGVLYCTLAGGADDSIAFVDLANGSVERTVTGVDNAGNLWYDSATNVLYVTNWTGLVELNGSTGASLAYLPIHWGVEPVVYDPVTGALLVADPGNGTIYVVNTSLNQVLSNLTFTDSGGGTVAAMLFDSQSRQIYTADYGDGNVSVIDAASMKVDVGTPAIHVGGVLTSLALDPGSHRLYVSNCAPPPLSFRTCIIYDSNDTLSAQTLPSSFPSFLAYDASQDRLFILNNNDSVYLVNGTSDRVQAWNPLVVGFLGATLDPDNGLVYAAAPNLGGTCLLPGSLWAFAPGPDPSLLGSIPVGDGPSQVAYDSTDHRLFVTDYCGNAITVVDSLNNSVVRLNLPVGQAPYGIVWDPSRDVVYVANENSQNLSIINASSLAAVSSLPLPLPYPYELAVDPRDHSVFVSDLFSSAVTVVNTTNQSVAIPSVPVGAGPQGMVYDSQSGRIYVANAGSNNVTFINASSGTVQGSVGVVGGPTALAIDPVNRLLFAAGSSGSRLSIIDLVNNTFLPPSFPTSTGPQSVVYVPTYRQVDVFDRGASAINILVNAPAPAAFTASPSPDELGHPVSFNLSVRNGTPPYSFNYSGLPLGCRPADAPALTCLPLAIGTSQVSASVTDAAGYQWRSMLSLTVLPESTIGPITFTVNPIDLGMNTTLGWNVTHGVSLASYSYAGLPPGCLSTNASSVSCAPTGAGTFLVQGTVTDVLGIVRNSWGLLQVNSPPLILSLVAVPTPVVQNSTLVFSASAVGGTGSLSFQYIGLPPGCSSTVGPTIACQPTQTGNYTIDLVVRDSLGAVARANVSIQVVRTLTQSTPGPPEIAAFFADPATVPIGSSVTLNVIAVSGEPPYGVVFRSLPPGCGTGETNQTDLTCRPSAIGHYKVGVSVTDLLGRTAAAWADLDVISNTTQVSPVGPGIAPAILLFSAGGLGGISGFAASVGASWWSRRRRAAPAKNPVDSR